MRYSWIILFLLTLSIPSSVLGSSVTLADQIQAANLLIFQGSEISCSGTLLHIEQRLMITNHHCIERAITKFEEDQRQEDGSIKKVMKEKFELVAVGQVTYQDWRIVGSQLFDARILFYNAEFDLALLQLVSKTIPFQIAARLPQETFELQPLDPIVVIGNPVGQENTLTRGIVSNTNRVVKVYGKPYFYFQFDASIAPGSSGGAIYFVGSDPARTQLYMIGIPAAKVPTTNVNFAIPLRIIHQFLRGIGYEWLWRSEKE